MRISKEVDMTKLTRLLTRYSAWLKACVWLFVLFLVTDKVIDDLYRQWFVMIKPQLAGIKGVAAGLLIFLVGLTVAFMGVKRSERNLAWFFIMSTIGMLVALFGFNLAVFLL